MQPYACDTKGEGLYNPYSLCQLKPVMIPKNEMVNYLIFLIIIPLAHFVIVLQNGRING